MIHYTPVNIDKYSNKNQAVPQHKNGLNFILLLIALITAIAFAVLLFVMIKNKNEEKIIIPPETPAKNINKKESTVIEKIIPAITTQEVKLTNNFGITSFVENNKDTWSLKWHITLSPDDVNTNSFQLVSKLKSQIPEETKNLVDFDENMSFKILVDRKEIQPHPNDPVDIEFRLNNKPHLNSSGPRGYQYLDIPSGFSRTGNKNSKGDPINAYGSSFAIYFLGSKIINMQFKNQGNFIDSKILTATIETKDDKNSYTYEIFLEKIPN